MAYTFNGGVHPYDGKELSKDKSIRDFKPVGDMVYPLSQHIGAPAKPVVAKGDTVLVGSLLAEAAGFVSANIFSAVSGTVKAIEKRRVPTGDMVESIVVENDGEFKTVEFRLEEKIEDLSSEEIIECVKKAGVVGMGGAGFPTHVKLSPKEPEKIEYIIANCAECEPYLTSDYRIMLEETDSLIGGIKVMLKLFKNAKAILAIEDNKMDCIELLTEKTKDEERIEVKPLITKYPQGSERQLIYAATGRAVNSSMLPADVGCIVDNVDTVVAIYNASVKKRPLLRRIVTITGDAIKEPCNFNVPLGTNFEELIEAAGGFRESPQKIISGGPMMGFAVFDTNIPVVKTSSSLLCMVKDEVSEAKETACINCGMCVEVCPSRLIPSRLADFSKQGNSDMFLKYNGLECMECGSCSYICPAKRQLAQLVKSRRKIELANRKK